MQIDILTLFPKMFKGPFDDSIIKRAQDDELVTINIHNLRDWAEGKSKQVDDKPYGGGAGMVLKVEPVYKAVEELKEEFAKEHKDDKKAFTHTILATPRGRPFNFRIADKLSDLPHLIFICGHYEGTDHRIFDEIADERLSIGDYILTGGEIPAMVMVDAVVRLVDDVLGKEESKEAESFSFNEVMLKYPQYTRPEEFKGMEVPEVLLSGDHQKIKEWRKKKAREITKKMRPDLLDQNF